MPEDLLLPDLDDDTLAEMLVDELLAQAEHNPRMRRAALRAVGMIKSPAEMTLAELAREHQCSVSRLTEIARDALGKMRRRMQNEESDRSTRSYGSHKHEEKKP